MSLTRKNLKLLPSDNSSSKFSIPLIDPSGIEERAIHSFQSFLAQGRFGDSFDSPMKLKWQGRRELNPQPLVLETSALPIELHPYRRIHSAILVTTPEPTVRPPSRMAKRTPSSIAIGLCNSTSSLTLSPGMHISAPTRLAVPVTSVVRK